MQGVSLLPVGVLRRLPKGWAYYSVNMFFWAKMAAFAAVALLSIAPTIRIIRWRRALAGDVAFAPAAADIANVRRFLWPRQRSSHSFPRSPPPWREATVQWRSDG